MRDIKEKNTICDRHKNNLHMRKVLISLVGWLFCFMPYQPFVGHLMSNQVILIKTVCLV